MKLLEEIYYGNIIVQITTSIYLQGKWIADEEEDQYEAIVEYL